MKHKRILLRLLGNWGVSFFGPLVSTNIAETIYNIGLTFEQTIVIAGVSSIFVSQAGPAPDPRESHRQPQTTDSRRRRDVLYRCAIPGPAGVRLRPGRPL